MSMGMSSGRSPHNINTNALLAAVNMLGRANAQPNSVPRSHSAPHHKNVDSQPQYKAAIQPREPQAQEEPTPAVPTSTVDHTARSRTLLGVIFLLRCLILVVVLYWVIGVHVANKYAIEVWHQAVVGRKCDEANTTAELPRWLASRGQTDALQTMIILLASAIVMTAAEFVMAASDAMGRLDHGTLVSRCVVFYYYRIRHTKALWLVATVTLLVALVVASVHAAELPRGGQWRIPACAEAAGSDWLYVGTAAFAWVPVGIFTVLILDVLGWVLSVRHGRGKACTRNSNEHV